MTPDDVKARAVEVLASHPSIRTEAHAFSYACPTCGIEESGGPNSPAHADHQIAMLHAAGLLADPTLAARAIREATNALMDDAASSDYLAGEVSDDGLAWIAQRLRDRADRIERQEIRNDPR
jgi:hypothetical protein